MEPDDRFPLSKCETCWNISDCWTFSIDCENPTNVNSLLVPFSVIDSFARDGFAVFPHVLPTSTVHDLNQHLEEILRGRYDRGGKPDKTPKLLRTEYTSNSNPSNTRALDEAMATRHNDKIHHHHRPEKTKVSNATGPLGFTGNLQNVKVLQVINVHKADSLFRKLATSPLLGRMVAELAGWTGTRLAQDQIWAKPPGAPPLTFHRDSPYFMFSPADVVTVWVALDDMDEESIGPLQYVRGSHRWGDGRTGSANQFFDSHGGTALLESAAIREGKSQLEFVSMVGLMAGGISIHHGRTWHGSGPNQSRVRPRRGLGLHFVPAHVRFTAEAAKSRLWKSYLGDGTIDPAEIDLPEEEFPITWFAKN